MFGRVSIKGKWSFLLWEMNKDWKKEFNNAEGESNATNKSKIKLASSSKYSVYSVTSLTKLSIIALIFNLVIDIY